MSTPVVFIDRDGTLIEEPADQQVDSLAKVRFMPGVFAALGELRRRGFRLAMVTNQDGLGTASFPQLSFEEPQQFMLEVFKSQGIEFDAVFVCPHFKSDGCECRKPKPGLVKDYLRDADVDLSRSVMIGDRDTDLEFARNIGVRGLRVLRHGTPEESWPALVRAVSARRAQVERRTKETRIDVRVNLDDTAPIHITTGIGFFDHMLEQISKHGGF